jgi:(S)-2-hydroxyglutarate dehydrogenase
MPPPKIVDKSERWLSQLKIGIIGGGIVGIAIGLAAFQRGFRDVTIFDKESKAGMHASSRNSGVIHSGIYYDSDSLKARFSIEGNEELRKLCFDEGIPIIDSGKLILSRDTKSEDLLTQLMFRAEANGVIATRYSSEELRRFEEKARTFNTFIHVKKTAVSSPEGVLSALRSRFDNLGGQWQLNTRVESAEALNSSKESRYGGFDLVINAAGSESLRLAKKLGLGSDLLTIPFLGLYWAVSSETLPLTIPLYPTPHPINPFLGVHLTPSVKGQTKIGPTAIPVLGREQYSFFRGIKLGESLEAIAALGRIGLGKRHSLSALISSELPKFARSFMIQEASHLMYGLDTIRGWHASPGGIRAQLVNKEGHLMQDFIVIKQDKTIHVLNAVSPGWTSALPFGRWIFENYVVGDKAD